MQYGYPSRFRISKNILTQYIYDKREQTLTVWALLMINCNGTNTPTDPTRDGHCDYQTEATFGLMQQKTDPPQKLL